MQRTPIHIPSWAPPAAIAGLVIWAVSIWWMVATLPQTADTRTIEDGLSIIATQTETARQEIADLATEVEALRAERDDLANRLEAIEARSSVSGAFALSTAGAGESSPGDLDTEQAAASMEATAIAGENHPLFTDRADRYNCRDFTSYDEAQEALRVNRPGDPNRIDMNDNQIACEDFRYPTPRTTAPQATVVP